MKKTIVVIVNQSLNVSYRMATDLVSKNNSLVYHRGISTIEIKDDLRVIFWRPDINSSRIDGLLFHELILMEYYSLLSDNQQCEVSIAEHQLNSNAKAMGFKPKKEIMTDDREVLKYLEGIIHKT